MKSIYSYYLLVSLFANTISAVVSSIKTTTNNIPSKAECLRGFLDTEFDLFAFEQYPTWFHNNSLLTLAEAGQYAGADAIEEYSRFASDTSPYVKNFVPEKLRTSLKDLVQVDENGICSFLIVVVSKYTLDPTTARSMTIEVMAMSRLFYDPIENYFPGAYVYFAKGYLDFVFGDAFNTPQTNNFVCDVIENVCGYHDQRDNCTTALDALPILQKESYFDGNSRACRTLHAAFATINPELHCPHVSFDPIPDSDNNFKCQGEGGSLDANDYFTEEDQESFRRFARRNGIDPEEGYRIVEEDDSFWSALLDLIKRIFGNVYLN